MTKNIKLPAPQLSQLKEVDIDLELNAKHYLELSTSDGKTSEEVITSILNDLMAQDANKLSLAEMRYLFMMVKINSLENELSATIVCKCGKEHTIDIKISDNDLNSTSEDYVVPEIELNLRDKLEIFKFMPPTMDVEIALLDWFMTVRNCTRDQIMNDKAVSFEFTFIRGIMHLVDKSGKRLINEIKDFEYALTLLEKVKYKALNELLDKMLEVDGYGVQNKVYEIECKECGETIKFHLPLLYGLVDN